MGRGNGAWSYLLAAGLVAGLAACGGDGGPPGGPGTPAPTPTPCTQTTLDQGPVPLDPRTLVYDDFSVPDTGRLDITVDWTVASSMIGVYLVPANTCTLQEFNARTCNFVVRSEVTTKPRKISTPNFAAGNYRWIIANFAQVQESASLLIVLSKGECPALAAPPAASGMAADSLPDLERMDHRR
jgi:hypothetical protein